MTCVIVDDDLISLKLVEQYVSLVPDLKLSGSFHSPLEAYKFVCNNKPEILFIDINMPEMSGLEFIKQIGNKTIIIFISGHRDFALDAFQLDATDYLLKPISFEVFLKAVN